jgi:hypothetical protein
MTTFKSDEQDQRIAAVLGENVEGIDFFDGVERFLVHFQKSLRLPCQVTGIEDFQWEEFYVLGPGRKKDYTVLRQTQPSYRDTYMLLKVEKSNASEWMLHPLEDLTAHVRRDSDRREFYLGLSELKAVDEESDEYRLLDDYAVWFVNCR